MIYLASTSPRRKKILRDHGIQFQVLKPDYEEKPLKGYTVLATVKKHALMKGLSAAHQVADGLIVSADTVVFFDRQIIGKPKNMKEAVRMLTMLQGNWHVVYTAAAILHVKNGKIKKKKVFCEKTHVFLKEMNEKDILRYFRSVRPLDKAGAYAIQSKNSIVSKIRGSFFNAMGLPWERIRSQFFGQEI